MKNRQTTYHLLALLSMILWGTTFVSTKVLLSAGLSPAYIMLWRFLLAYAGLCLLSRERLFAASLRDELLMAAGGLCGGSLYFLAENNALRITQVSNVSILIATAPVLTALFSHLWLRSEKIARPLVAGSLISLAGTVLVVLNGNFVLRLNPAGDGLALLGAALWALYSVVLGKLSDRYSTLLITRKVFFYGLVTLLPALLAEPAGPRFALLARPTVWLNLLFLGAVASLGCYLMWNKAVRELGAVRSASYLYINPIVALLTSHLILGETITPVAALGAALILGGVYLSERHRTGHPAPPSGRKKP